MPVSVAKENTSVASRSICVVGGWGKDLEGCPGDVQHDGHYAEPGLPGAQQVVGEFVDALEQAAADRDERT
jgi:hypothetical protein